jgi:hypothetical protein
LHLLLMREVQDCSVLLGLREPMRINTCVHRARMHSSLVTRLTFIVHCLSSSRSTRRVYSSTSSWKPAQCHKSHKAQARPLLDLPVPISL